ncbi:CG7560 [Drosophila busckii]|uniref:CG7560 n=1 Tax=Drosophila busckii TaxID=30019 RepID=A0A0M5J5S0_DROBS|nr:5,10-methylenetetrahydrofolate reductase [Drosophila busckii]ALC43694.1 CG7560 [Drosophila busckii]
MRVTAKLSPATAAAAGAGLRWSSVVAFKRRRPLSCYRWNQLSKRTQSVSSSLAMHALELPVRQNIGTHASDVPLETCFHYTPSQLQSCPQVESIAQLVANKTKSKKFFFGIEITADNHGKPTCVDFNQFLPVMPTFISIVWLASYWNVPIAKVQSLQMIQQLQQHIPAMPHFSVYRLTQQRLDEFLALNLSNMLAVRGDKVHEDQMYHFGHELVKYARDKRPDLSIGVAGYPMGYTKDQTETQEMDRIICYLKAKVDAGADFIITQFCYSPERIVEFLCAARRAGVDKPIMVGVVVPESFKLYALMETIANISLPEQQRAELELIKQDDEKCRQFFVQLALRTIKAVLEADQGVYGIQFYTMNRFKSVLEVIGELRKQGVLETPQQDDKF